MVIDLNFHINNKQKNEINIRTAVNLPGGTGKKLIAVVVKKTNLKKQKTQAQMRLVEMNLLKIKVEI